jgi:hypothetical protein
MRKFLKLAFYERPPMTRNTFEAVQITVAAPYCFEIFGAVGLPPVELIVTPAP